MAQATRIVATMGASDIGDIAEALKDIADTDTKTIKHMGVIVGMAGGVSYRSNKFGSGPSIALTGIFEGTPYDPNQPVIMAKSLFMPAAIQDILIATIMKGAEHAVKKAPKIGEKVDVELDGTQLPIRCEIGVSRSAGKSGAGYQFHIDLVGTQEKVDVLERLRADVIAQGSDRVKQLADPNRKYAAAAQLAGPKKKPVKKSAKK